MRRVGNLAVAFAATVVLAANLLNLFAWHSRPLFVLFVALAALTVVLLVRDRQREAGREHPR